MGLHAFRAVASGALLESGALLLKPGVTWTLLPGRRSGRPKCWHPSAPAPARGILVSHPNGSERD